MKKYNFGAVVEKVGSTLENKKGNWRKQMPVINQEKCTRCAICWMFCPDNAIFINKKGQYLVNYNYCKGCGVCANECPYNAIRMVEEKK